MKQIIQNLKTGETSLEEIPAPLIKPGSILIQTYCSLVSTGTEKMLVEFSRANLINKARLQPERVKQVLDKIKADGLLPTLQTVFNKLDEPLPLGYCNAGEVIAVGDGVTEFKKGDRVVSNGHHAEFVCIPRNLAALIPENLSYEEACFTPIAAIALQSIRLLNPTLGETIAIIGLGLIGQITAQLLIANGCNVIGFDIDDKRVELIKQKNISAYATSDPVTISNELTESAGVDGVLITASSKNNEIINQAAKMCRKRGRIILVGVIDLEINRTEFYTKELIFQVSCSYGPGRYDENYEQKGIDYPLSYVRWTEKRNFETVLDAMNAKKLTVSQLIDEIVDLRKSISIYNSLPRANNLTTLIRYKSNATLFDTQSKISNKTFDKNRAIAGIIGAGNFTRIILLPALKRSGAQIKYIASATGISATSLAKKYKIAHAASDYNVILDDKDVDIVFITTRHNQHACMVIEALNAEKHVYVEKPLAIHEDELKLIEAAYYNKLNQNKNISLTVGFNRRFSPFTAQAKKLLANASAPVNICYTVNAGKLPPEHWLNDVETGGGKILGEACHFIDYVRCITQSKIISVQATSSGKKGSTPDDVIIVLQCENNSQAVINYFTNGNKSYQKERIEIYSLGRVLIIDNFRTLRGYGFNRSHFFRPFQDKGHAAMLKNFVRVNKTGGNLLIPFEEIMNSSKATFAAVKSLAENKTITVD